MGIKYKDLHNLLRFVYLGNCKIDEINVPSFLSLAMELDLSSLEDITETKDFSNDTNSELVEKEFEIQKTNNLKGSSCGPSVYQVEETDQSIVIKKTNNLKATSCDSSIYKKEEEINQSIVIKETTIEKGDEELMNMFEDPNYDKGVNYSIESNKKHNYYEKLFNNTNIKTEGKKYIDKNKSKEVNNTEDGEIKQEITPYSCDKCDNRYKQSRKLREHIKFMQPVKSSCRPSCKASANVQDRLHHRPAYLNLNQILNLYQNLNKKANTHVSQVSLRILATPTWTMTTTMASRTSTAWMSPSQSTLSWPSTSA